MIWSLAKLFCAIWILPIIFEKMIEFAAKDAWVICIDTKREFECDGLYIDGMDYCSLCKHDGLEKHWRTDLVQQGRNYAAAIRTAHRMRKAGLKDVGYTFVKGTMISYGKK